MHPSCTCPRCGNALPINVAKGGRFPGHPYLHCSSCAYHYTFPKSPPETPFPISTPPHVVPPPALSPSLPLQFPAPLSLARVICACSRPAHRSCSNLKCKKCCINQASGCLLRDHNVGKLSLDKLKQLANLNPSLNSAPNLLRVTSILQNLDSLTSSDPTAQFLEQQSRLAQEKSVQEQRVLDIEAQEEADYQLAVARSLDLPFVTPTLAAPFNGMAVSGPSKSSTPAPVRTVSNAAPKITRHMNEVWMRPIEDNTKKARRPNRGDLDNRFTIIFWEQNAKPPIICAVHDCPHWPKWMLGEANDVQEDLGLSKELGTRRRMLQFYDTRNNHWVLCSPTYPHDVKKDGFLLLRLPNVICHDFDTHRENATKKPLHFRDNLAEERKIVKTMLRERRKPLPINIVTSLDIIAEKERVHIRKRLCDDEDIEQPTSQRLRTSHSPSPTISRSPSITASSPVPLHPYHSRSPSITASSPVPISLPHLRADSPVHDESLVFVPPTCVRWPDGMYANDMATGFHLVDSASMKKKYPHHSDRIRAVFGVSIPGSTFFDHRRYWKKASEEERITFIEAGHTEDGLWSSFPKFKST